MLLHRLALVPLVLLGALAIAAPAGQARAGARAPILAFADGTTIKGFVNALNNGDQNRAMSYVGPDFTLTMPDGTTYTGANAPGALLSLTTPITIVSLAPQGNRVLDVVVQFGNGPSVWVQFMGEGGGLISTMTVYPPANS